jgi:hypothetical protein
MFDSLSAEQQLGFQQSAGLLSASDENESSTEFPNGRRKTISKCAQKSRENKAISVMNSAYC